MAKSFVRALVLAKDPAEVQELIGQIDQWQGAKFKAFGAYFRKEWIQ